MLSRVGQQAQPLAMARGLATSAAAMAAPAVATKGSNLLSLFGFGCSRVDTPLSEALAGVPEPIRSSPLTAAPSVQTSSLDVGAKVTTIESASPLATVALVVQAGSAHETAETAGAAKVLEAMAFKATQNRTTFRLVRELEKLGATSFATAGREYTVFGINTVKMHTPEAVEILVDSVVNARQTYWEVRDTLEAVQEQLAGALKCPKTVLSEVLHKAAFEGGLGQPLVLDPSLLDGFSNETLKAFVSANVQPSRIVLAGVGVDHAEFKALASPLFPAATGAAGKAASSSYVGGVLNVVAPVSSSHCALAFEVKGGVQDSANVAVTKALLGADSRSPLPHSSKESSVFSSLSAFSNLYSSTGLIGVSGSAASSQSKELVDGLCKKVEDVAKGVTDAQLKQAKAVAVANCKQLMASAPGMASVLGPQVLLTGKFAPAEMLSKIEGVTAADVTSFLSKTLKTPATLATYGSLSSLPRYEAIAKRFA